MYPNTHANVSFFLGHEQYGPVLAREREKEREKGGLLCSGLEEGSLGFGGSEGLVDIL